MDFEAEAEAIDALAQDFRHVIAGVGSQDALALQNGGAVERVEHVDAERQAGALEAQLFFHPQVEEVDGGIAEGVDAGRDGQVGRPADVQGGDEDPADVADRVALAAEQRSGQVEAPPAIRRDLIQAVE